MGLLLGLSLEIGINVLIFSGAEVGIDSKNLIITDPRTTGSLCPSLI